jgi:uncharacterized membrane protein
VPAKNTVEVIINGKDNLTSSLAGIHKTLNNFGANIRSALSPSIAGFNIDLVSMGKELLNLGIQSETASFQLTKFAGSQERAKAMTEAFIRGADDQVTSIEAMASATDLLRRGLASTPEEMEKIANMAVKLGDTSASATAKIDAFTNMLNLGSTRGLNQFGLNAEKVEVRIKALVKTGMTQKDAFRAAVFEEASAALLTLGDDSMLLGEKLDKMKVAWKEAKIGAGGLGIEMLKALEPIWSLGLGVEEFTKRLRVLPETFKQTVAIIIYGYTYWDQFVEHLGNTKVALFEAKGAVAEYLKANQDLVPSIAEVSEKETKFIYITNEEVKARLEANRVAQDSIKLTDELAGAIGGMSESLKDATQAQIASAAIKGLTAAWQAGKVSMDDYLKTMGDLQIATGLATPESVKLATQIQLNSQALVDGTGSLEGWTTATNALVASGKAATAQLSEETKATMDLVVATGEMGESLKDATGMQIASAAMSGLTEAYKKGKLSEEEYIRESNGLRIAVGLATPESIKMAEAIRENNAALLDGTENVSYWRMEIDKLVASSSDALAATQELTVATGQLSESLKGATAAQIAGIAITELTNAYKAGTIGEQEYTQAANDLRIANGLATPETVALAAAFQLNNKALAEGTIGLEQWLASARQMIAEGAAATKAQEDAAKAMEEAKKKEEEAAEARKKAIQEQIQATIDLTVATGQLSESLKNATAAQIASAAIEGLTAAYKAGKISQEQYIKAANDLRVASGLATPESIKLASAIELNNKQLADGVINMEQWRKAMDALMASRMEGWEKPAPIVLRGGLEGKQKGGSARVSGWQMTGERGPEMTFLPRGSFVLNAADTRRFMGATGGGEGSAVSSSNYYFNQTVNTRATVSTVAQDFQMMRALVA